MVAQKNKIMKHSAPFGQAANLPDVHWPGRWEFRRGFSVMAITALLLLSQEMLGQNFRNSGKITNTGTIRVKSQAIGITDTLNGTFELFGVNQTVPATQFGDLLLSGTGNFTTAGNASVMKTLTIAPAVALQVPLNSAITLGESAGKLTENGYLSGKIKKTVDLAGVTPDTAFGGIGASISWNGNNPGITTITRTSGQSVVVNGKQSIQRYFDVQAANSSNLNASLKFSYANSELVGADPATLELWRSPDNGSTWRRHRVTRNGNTLIRQGIPTFGRWTASDGSNLLGLAKYEYEADTVRLLAGDGQIGRVKRLLDTVFVAAVTDAFGQPAAGQVVQFVVSQKPVNAVGDSLTATSAVADSLGRVQTNLKLGSVKGTYVVQASVTGVSSAIASFQVTAKPVAAAMEALPLAATTDSVKSFIGPISVRVKDSDSAVVEGAQINFAVSSIPDSAVGYQLSNSTMTTDTLGIANTVLKLGNKIGTYMVTATSPDVEPVVTRKFLINALPGTAANVDFAGGGVDTVTAYKNFSVRILDTEKNPRRGDTVLFSMTGKPVGSTFDSLYTLSAITDSNGIAVTTLRVGEKAGSYTVAASLKNRPQFNTVFATTARSLAATKLLVSSTTAADTIGAVLQPFSLNLADKYDNPVPAATVNFSIIQRPDTSSGGSLSISTVQTDSSQGQASSVFTAGDKVGTYIVRATSGSMTQDFTVQVAPGKPALMIAAGIFQSKVVYQPLDSVFAVTLTDRKGNPRTSLPVRFSVIQKPAGAVGDKLTPVTTITNPQGIATTQLTLGNKIGQYIVAAFSDSLRGVIKTFTANALNSVAVRIDSVGGLNQVKPILSKLDNDFVVSVTDKGGNPVSGVVVNFAIANRPIGTTQDTLFKYADTTNSLGQASTSMKLGTKVGNYAVVATSPTLPSLSRLFTAQAVNGAAFTLESRGAGQRDVPNKRLDSAFVVYVKDFGDNPIAGTQVLFSIVKTPSAATVGHFLSDTTVMTDAQGRASTRLTLGNQIGSYAVTASVGGTLIDTLSASAFLLAGDANMDADINIGDLTAVIDKILGKIAMSASDSAATDVNADGVIDIRDAILMRDRLLTGTWSQHVVDTLLVLSNPLDDKRTARASVIPAHVTGDTSVQGAFALSNEIEITENGLRINLSNNEPVKGLQYILKMKNPPVIKKPDVIYNRAKMMTVLIFPTDSTLRIVAYNLDNSPIMPGEGSIFRLPISASRVDDIDTLGSELIVSKGDVNTAVTMPFVNIRKAIGVYPLSYKLEQNYPNPFNNSTIIYYEVPDVAGKFARATLQVFNILGEKVKTLVKEDKESGRYSVMWDGTNDNGMKVASGTYIYRLVIKEYQTAKKMLLIK